MKILKKKLKRVKRKMANKMKTDNGSPRPMTEEEIKKMKEDIEGDKREKE